MVKELWGKLLAVAVFCLILVLALASTRRNQETYSMAPSNVDKKIGDAFFKLEKQDGHTVAMEPLLAPRFKLRILGGDGVESNAITKCGVYNRTMQVDEKEMSIYSITVLRCGHNAYGLSEVDFRYEKEEK